MFMRFGSHASTILAPAAWSAFEMYHAKPMLSPTPVTKAILPEKSMGIMARGSRNDTARGRLVRGPFYQLPPASPTPIALAALRLPLPDNHFADRGFGLLHDLARKRAAAGHEVLPVLLPRHGGEREAPAHQVFDV